MTDRALLLQVLYAELPIAHRTTVSCLNHIHVWLELVYLPVQKHGTCSVVLGMQLP